MAKKQTQFPVSEELKNTVLTHPGITEVHFRADGKHYFNAYKHGTSLYGQVHTDKVKDPKKNVIMDIHTPVQASRIVETLTRADILGTEDK